MNKLMIGLMALLMVAGFGCSENESRPTAPGPYVYPYPTPDPNENPNPDSGASVYLDYVNTAVFEDFVGHPVSDPQEVKLHVDLRDVDPSDVDLFGGSTYFSYDDDDGWGNNVHHSSRFDAGDDEYEAQYNRWVDSDGTQRFVAFMEDQWGALIIVADQMTNDLGTWSGSVYYRNWNLDVCNTQYPYYCAPKPPTKCWFISLGPYNCQAYLDNGDINLESRLYPETYTLLGTFENLDMNAALNLD